MNYEERITDGQRHSIRTLLDSCVGVELDHDTRIYILSRLISRDIRNSSEVLLREWKVIRNSAFPFWREPENDWQTINYDFKVRIAQFLEEYRELHLGQMRLF